MADLRIKYRLTGMLYTIILVELIWWAVFIVGYFILAPLIPELSFDKPVWAWVGLAGLLMNLIFLILIRWKNKKLTQFGNQALLPNFIQATSSVKTLLKFLFLRFAFA